jgi:cell division septum initiation protein DivIVA
MKRRAEIVAVEQVVPALEEAPTAPLVYAEGWRDLEDWLYDRPFFGVRLRGYARAEVDEYVRAAEAEVAAAHRQAALLLERYTSCTAELELARRSPAQPPSAAQPSVVPSAVPGRVGEILRLAADEATAMTDAAAEEADRLLSEARTEAEAWVSKARRIREVAEQDRAEAADRLARAQRAAEDLLRAASTERARLAVETGQRLAHEEERARQDRETAEAASAARLAAVEREVTDLRRQRDEARESLHRLTAQIGQALQAVGLTGGGEARYTFTGNAVAP